MENPQQMIKSMTGFAAAEVIAGEITVSVDIRAYNSRYLDVVLRMPSSYMSLEEKLKGVINRRVTRGRLEVKVQIKDVSEGAIAFEIDWARARGMHEALLELRDELDLKNEITVDNLLSVGGMVRPVDTVDNTDKIWLTLEDCLNRALVDLEAMRAKEGDYIAEDLTSRLSFIEEGLNDIKGDANHLIGLYQERLKERIAALTQETVELDPVRLAQEAAYLADRSDISEEIVRAESHVEQFRHIMQSEEPGGRKLNFLLQELHREFNTIGSKIGQANAAHRVVDVKAELEKIREQIQNVE
jgi:uncharacterized protein (TIGR00255 family)